MNFTPFAPMMKLGISLIKNAYVPTSAGVASGNSRAISAGSGSAWTNGRLSCAGDVRWKCLRRQGLAQCGGAADPADLDGMRGLLGRRNRGCSLCFDALI